jgi:hypothetical protein
VKLALWQNCRSGKTDWHFSKLALWQNWRSGETVALVKLALWQNWRSGKLAGTLANWRSGETGSLAKLAIWQTGALAKLALRQMDKKPKNVDNFGVWHSESLLVRHSLYNYHILFITRIILYIICDVFCALLHSLITRSDMGLENMIQTRGCNRGSIITGNRTLLGIFEGLLGG